MSNETCNTLIAYRDLYGNPVEGSLEGGGYCYHGDGKITVRVVWTYADGEICTADVEVTDGYATGSSEILWDMEPVDALENLEELIDIALEEAYAD